MPRRRASRASKGGATASLPSHHLRGGPARAVDRSAVLPSRRVAFPPCCLPAVLPSRRAAFP
eukprot:3677727-Prymnesium_polylepis.1